MKIRTRIARGRSDGTREGFIMIEVMAAVVILGTLVVSLAPSAQSSRDAAVLLRTNLAVMAQRTLADSGSAWRWGGAITETVWSPGPELALRVRGAVAGTMTVGIWSDGWALGEWLASDEREVRLGPSEWLGLEGEEVIIRARCADGGWGPPWRSVVPGVFGPGEAARYVGIPSAEDDLVQTADPSVGHAPSACTAGIEVGGTGCTTALQAGGVTVFLLTPPAALCRATCQGRVQEWMADRDRGLDVYF